MKADAVKPAVQRPRAESLPPEQASSDPGMDTTLLEESLAKTVWERLLANDDALRLADSLRTAVLKAHAKPQ